MIGIREVGFLIVANSILFLGLSLWMSKATGMSKRATPRPSPMLVRNETFRMETPARKSWHLAPPRPASRGIRRGLTWAGKRLSHTMRDEVPR
jgi:hypothetical protein